MKANLYFCVEGHSKPVLVMIGTGSPYAVHKHPDGKDYKAASIVRDVEVGSTDKAGYPAWHAALEVKHGPAAVKLKK